LVQFSAVTDRLSIDVVMPGRRVSAQQNRQQMSTVNTATSPPATPVAKTTAVTVGATFTPPPTNTDRPAMPPPATSTCRTDPSNITYTSPATVRVVV